ncbi:uncharacterized protein LOC142505359 isoform X2 [Primulina tabacum]|uniref:uncharacterized protein LOC142505359 isoform X2 n=1 Tax=Primulina tabacum TaxID=48773 RepID=UPI003F5A9BEB
MASVQFRPQNRNLAMVMREVDENLAIFLGVRNVEKERSEHLIKDSDELDDSAEQKSDGPVLESNGLELEIVQSAADENSHNLEIDKNDYDWLYGQPASTLHPSDALEVKDSESSLTEITNGGGMVLKSEPLSSGDQRKTRRATPPNRGKSALPAKSKPSRASTPTSKPTLLSSKPTSANSRSSTPVRTTPRSSIPVGRPSMPVSSKPAPRSTAPTCKPAAALTTSGLSGSVRKMGSVTMKNLKNLGSNPSEILSLSHDDSENPKILMPKRTVSASRGRPNGHASNLSRNGKRRQNSCSPAKIRTPTTNTAHKNGSMIQSRSRGHSNGDDDVNPVLIGSKMVERVVNMRKLAPPKQDEHSSHDNSKKSSHDNSGFGRSLSKKSLDMAIRHMEIRRTIPDDLHTLATRVLSSVSAKYASAGNTESPLTSSSDSFKSSIYNSSRFLDGSETEDNVSIDSKHSTASSQ